MIFYTLRDETTALKTNRLGLGVGSWSLVKTEIGFSKHCVLLGISCRVQLERRVPKSEHHKVITVSKQMESHGIG